MTPGMAYDRQFYRLEGTPLQYEIKLMLQAFLTRLTALDSQLVDFARDEGDLVRNAVCSFPDGGLTPQREHFWSSSSSKKVLSLIRDRCSTLMIIREGECSTREIQ